MKIAYRRMSGAIGLSLEEKGTRGLWWEKRRAILAVLRDRGHQVDIVNRLTKPSQGFVREAHELKEDTDILMVEFGSSNTSFYGKDLEMTQALIERHKGKIVFLCDDPDLPYLWKTVKTGFDRWSVWMNAKFPQPFAGQPAEIRCFDFPVSTLQSPETPSRHYQKDALVYIGRPGGRQTAVNDLIAHRAPWRVYGKAKEWDGFGVPVFEAPDQPRRAAFYNSQIGSLVLADSKHKRLGWRTGRAYHAIMAGCPAVVEASHVALNGLRTFENAADLPQVLAEWKDPEKRLTDWKKQINWVLAERAILEATLAAHGL